MLNTDYLAPEKIRPLCRSEYDRMVELGWFDDERLELLEGVLVTMSPQGSLHAEVVQRLTMRLAAAVQGRAQARIQSPLAVSDGSEPEPDVAVVAPGDYSRGHPQTAWLVIEVADSSVNKDRNIKANLYAAAEVDEYWLVNLVDGVIEVHRDPAEGVYEQITTFARGQTLSIAKLPDVSIRIDEILPSL